MKIYKLCYTDDLNARETFNQIELYTALGLQDRLRQAIENEQLTEDTLEKYGLTTETNCEEIPVDTVVKIFCDDGYECEEDWLWAPELDQED